jgi:competence protein ComFC
VVDAFGKGPAVGLVKGKVVLVIDDVWTTGATLRECAKVLKQAGAKEVYGFTFTRAG